MVKKIISILLLVSGMGIFLFSLLEEKIVETINLAKIEATVKTNDYYAILEIPKINLKRAIYPVNHELNDVAKNLFLHNKSVMPEDDFSNVIIAGHSGSGVKAIFKDLEKLNINDLIIFNYNNFKYTYQIKEKEYQNKTGTLYLKTDYHEMMTLITCTTNNKATQTIYYAQILTKEKLANL